MKKIIALILLSNALVLTASVAVWAQPIIIGPAADGGTNSPVHVTATTSQLTALAHDSDAGTLTYLWVIADPLASVTFPAPTLTSPTSGPSCGGIYSCSDAQNPIITFRHTGTYYVFLTVTNQSTGQSAQSNGSLNIQVDPVPGTQIVVKPNPGAVEPSQNALFTACILDQFGFCAAKVSLNYTWATTVPGCTITRNPADPSIATFHADATTPLGLYHDKISASAPSKTTGTTDVIVDFPTVTASANPNPVTTGKTTVLTATGNDPMYTDPSTWIYQWTYAPVAPTPATNVVDLSDPFNDNPARVITAKFHHAGKYKFTVVMTNPIGLEAQGSVTVDVNQDLVGGSIDVTPKDQAVVHGQQQQYTATASDQFGDPLLAQAFTWTSTLPTTVNNSGLLTAGTASTPAGAFTVTASVPAKSASGSANGTIVNAAPNTPVLTANPNPTTTKTSLITGTATDPDDAAATLTYTWSAPAGVTFTKANPTNTLSNTAQFPNLGTYRIQVIANDPAGNHSAAGFVDVVVNLGATTIDVNPKDQAIKHGLTQSYSAIELDQFNNPMATQPASFAWTSTLPTTVNSTTGLLTAGTAATPAGPFTITAIDGGLSGSANGTIVNAAPNTPNLIASPNPTTTKTSDISGTDTDDDDDSTSLTYTWSAPAGVTFTKANPTTVLSNTAQFPHIGVFRIQAIATDLAGNNSSAGFVDVTVTQGASTIDVNPKGQAVKHGTTQAYTATVVDQFGNAMAVQPPTFTWTSTLPTTINSGSGLLTAGSASTPAGPFTVTATNSGLSGSADGTITNTAPHAPTLTASPNPTTTKTSAITGTDSDDDDTAASLTYTWSGPAGVTFVTPNPTPTLSNTAQFPSIGVFRIQVMATDPAGNNSAIGFVDVTVNQGATSIDVNPKGQAVPHGKTQPYTATVVDQFNNPIISAPVTWSSTLPTTINAVSGLLTAGTASTPAGPFTVTATLGSISGSANGLITNAAPNAPALTANPNPTITKTSDISGTDSDPDDETTALTYTWSAPAGVTFTKSNPTTTLSNTAQFPGLGVFRIQVMATDPAGNNSSVGFVDVTVNQGASTIDVNPKGQTVKHGTTQDYTATVLDQFGTALLTQPPAFSWTSTLPTTVNSTTGLLTAGTASTPAGPFTITATFGGLSGSADGTITNVAPHAPSLIANPNPTITKTSDISGTDSDADDDAASLTYSWSGPAGVTFTNANPTSVLSNTAQFPGLGIFRIQVIATDPAGNHSPAGFVDVTVDQGATTIDVTPKGKAVKHGTTQSYTARMLDQFGQAMAIQPPSFAWSSTLPTTVDPVSGVLTAGTGSTPAGAFTITATASGRSGNTDGTIVNAAPNVPQISATPNPTVTGATDISFTDTDADDDTSSLNYQWSVPPGVTFSNPGPGLLHSAGDNTHVDFPALGLYHLVLTITDPAGNQNTGSVDVLVSKTPVIYTLSPSSAPALSGPLTLSIDGDFFEPNAQVLWNGSPRPTIYVSSQKVTATISKQDLGSIYTANITVKDPSPNLTSNALPFDVYGVLSKVVVDPDGKSISLGDQLQFTARSYNQLGQEIPNQSYRWQTLGESGSISAAGLFRSPTDFHGKSVFTIQATNNGVTGTAHVTVYVGGIPQNDICGVVPYPVPYKSNSGLAGITFTRMAPGTSVRIYSIDSRLVQTLVSEDGQDVLWDVRNSAGDKVASGVYFYLLNQNGTCSTNKGKLVVIQ